MLEFEKLIKRLHEHRVRHVIVGGLAAVAHGSAYITADLDLCYQRTEANYIALEKALHPLHPKLRGAPSGLPFQWDRWTIKSGLNFTLITDLGDLDLLGEIAGLGIYEKVLAHAERIRLYGIPCDILSVDGLIKAKKAAARPKDLALLKELEALQVLKKK